ncbi:putative NADH-dependent butanol dehydrogenase 2 [[Clostridium] cellulosi]|uniref:Putative NADH-dependent butanol dehydrogenase 2 n=1 Tax=[Clostridium] cellulosi TaxID=29343 RepID=A0A078KM12_9FIRM|nr:putative NADH-dependent butanol dehydrogenase 2 [[Clostridium] cellulosi]
MENFTFYAPTYFSFGKGSEKDIGALVKRFGGKKVLVHYGGGSVKRNGIFDKVIASLNESNIPYVELGGVRPNPRSGLVYKGIDICRKENIDFILAVGGGSVIDSAKAIAAGTVYDGDFWDYYSTGKKVDRALPVGTVLTIAAAGSEGSPDSVITHEDGMYKRGASGEALRPKFSILNPEFTETLPAYQTACGISDIMAHVCERYFSNTKNVEITDRLCEGVLKAMIEESPKVIKNPHDYEARANIMWAGMVAHNNIVGVGREQDWSSHAIEHELSALYDVAHGAGLAVIVPAWMKYVMKKNLGKFVQFAVRVWGCDMNFENPEITAMEGINRYSAFLTSLGMPSNFKELGAKEEDIPTLVKHLGATDENPIGGYVKLGPKDIEAIYRLAL